VTAFLVGRREWAVIVRRRADDPFGPPVVVERVEPWSSPGVVFRRVRQAVRDGDIFTESSSTADPSTPPHRQA